MEDAEGVMRGGLAHAPPAATLRVEPFSAFAVAPRRVVGAKVALDLLEWWRRELDLRKWVYPGDD
jgi:hypothetical protein